MLKAPKTKQRVKGSGSRSKGLWKRSKCRHHWGLSAQPALCQERTVELPTVVEQEEDSGDVTVLVFVIGGDLTEESE